MERRAKIRAARTGKRHDRLTRIKISDAMYRRSDDALLYRAGRAIDGKRVAHDGA